MTVENYIQLDGSRTPSNSSKRSQSFVRLSETWSNNKYLCGENLTCPAPGFVLS